MTLIKPGSQYDAGQAFSINLLSFFMCFTLYVEIGLNPIPVSI